MDEAIEAMRNERDAAIERAERAEAKKTATYRQLVHTRGLLDDREESLLSLTAALSDYERMMEQAEADCRALAAEVQRLLASGNQISQPVCEILEKWLK